MPDVWIVYLLKSEEKKKLKRYGKHFIEEGQLDGAKAMFEIVYELTENESIKDILDNLPES